jgi:hypothetical protein
MAETCEIVGTAPKIDAVHSTRWQRWVVLLWALAVFGGLFLLWRYSGTPGESSKPPQKWPESSALTLSTAGDTLLMFVHPRCPCTRASLAQLARVAAQCNGNFTPWIVFSKPKGAGDDWQDGDLWEIAGAIPGAQRYIDRDGIETERFHAATSGQTLVYDPSGELLFHGGITGARGHEGDNDGQDSVVQILNGRNSMFRETPVFGCPINSNSSTK